jgi:putative ABC transport system ATP-binding protein
VLEDLNQRGATLIVITHDQEIGARARRRISMEDGRVIGDTQS